jgi:hypothetical protein
LIIQAFNLAVKALIAIAFPHGKRPISDIKYAKD